MKLHETIKNIYLKCFKPLFKIEVFSNGRWNKISSFNITEKQQMYKIKTEKHSLICTENHILIAADNSEIKAIDSFNKDVITDNGIEKVISVEKTNIYDNAYDLSLDDESDHLYYANGMLSHNCVILDEFAFLQKNIADKLFTSMYPVISSSKNGKFIIVSTPNGVDNLYYNIWQQANSKEKDKNAEGWKSFTMWWWQVPGHDEKWKQEQIASIGKEKFAQEFNNEFLVGASSKKLIPDEIIEKYRIKQSEIRVQDKKLLEGKKQKIYSENGEKVYEFTMWHEFNSKRTYMASGDVAEGIGSDYSVLYVWDITDLSNIVQCAKFNSNNVSTIEFAYITSKILKLYGSPYYICEKNGVGSGYLDALRLTYCYENIVREGKSNEPGVFCHVSVKGKSCLWAREMLMTKGFGWTIYDPDLIEEFTTFLKKDTKGTNIVYCATAPARDDHIMSWIWACYMLQPDVVQQYYICVSSFTSDLGKIYPKILQPLKEYQDEEIKQISDDPMYKEFLEFKNEVKLKIDSVLSSSAGKDMMFIDPETHKDIYFGDIDDGPSWNVRQQSHVQDFQNMNPNNYMPQFYI